MSILRLKNRKGIVTRLTEIYGLKTNDLYWANRPGIKLVIDGEGNLVKLNITIYPSHDK